jgi:hypothetical protein
MNDNSTYIIAGNLTTAYFTVNSTALKGEINKNGMREPVTPEIIWSVFKKFVTLVEEENKMPV